MELDIFSRRGVWIFRIILDGRVVLFVVDVKPFDLCMRFAGYFLGNKFVNHRCDQPRIRLHSINVRRFFSCYHATSRIDGVVVKKFVCPVDPYRIGELCKVVFFKMRRDDAASTHDRVVVVSRLALASSFGTGSKKPRFHAILYQLSICL